MVDGGSVDGVVVSNIRMQNVRAPIFVRLGDRKPKEGTFLRNVLIEGVDAAGAIVSSSITGVPGLRPTDITVSNCRIRTVEQGQAAWAHREIPEVADKYPEARMMGRLPSYGFFVRHADRVRLRNIECITDQAGRAAGDRLRRCGRCDSRRPGSVRSGWRSAAIGPEKYTPRFSDWYALPGRRQSIRTSQWHWLIRYSARRKRPGCGSTGCDLSRWRHGGLDKNCLSPGESCYDPHCVSLAPYCY